jgi:hypothetical protein
LFGLEFIYFFLGELGTTLAFKLTLLDILDALEGILQDGLLPFEFLLQHSHLSSFHLVLLSQFDDALRLALLLLLLQPS